MVGIYNFPLNLTCRGPILNRETQVHTSGELPNQNQQNVLCKLGKNLFDFSESKILELKSIHQTSNSKGNKRFATQEEKPFKEQDPHTCE